MKPPPPPEAADQPPGPPAAVELDWTRSHVEDLSPDPVRLQPTSLGTVWPVGVGKMLRCANERGHAHLQMAVALPDVIISRNDDLPHNSPRRNTLCIALLLCFHFFHFVFVNKNKFYRSSQVRVKLLFFHVVLFFDIIEGQRQKHSHILLFLIAINIFKHLSIIRVKNL